MHTETSPQRLRVSGVECQPDGTLCIRASRCNDHGDPVQFLIELDPAERDNLIVDLLRPGNPPVVPRASEATVRRQIADALVEARRRTKELQATGRTMGEYEPLVVVVPECAEVLADCDARTAAELIARMGRKVQVSIELHSTSKYPGAVSEFGGSALLRQTALLGTVIRYQHKEMPAR